MTCLVPGVAMTFAGTSAPTAFVAVKNIGKMKPAETNALSEGLCAAPREGPRRAARPAVYVEFDDAVDYLWGWNGGTFG